MTLADLAAIRSAFIYESAPFPSCHASTIVETPEGVVRRDSAARRRAIYLSRFVSGAWSAPAKAAGGVQESGQRYTCYSPVLFLSRYGPLLLFYKVGPSPSTWWGMLTTSADNGRTWSRPTRLPDGVLGPIKNTPLELPNGDLLCPSSSEVQGRRVHFERTADGGRTWTTTPPLNDAKRIGAIQPSILVHRDHLQAIGRTRKGRLFTIDSSDGGRTWGTMSLLDVPNPNSGTDAVTLADHRFLLVYNDAPRGHTPLNVAISRDGAAWRNVLTLESDPEDYFYPAVIQARDGLVHVTYTWNRKRIKQAVLDPGRITAPA